MGLIMETTITTGYLSVMSATNSNSIKNQQHLG